MNRLIKEQIEKYYSQFNFNQLSDIQIEDTLTSIAKDKLQYFANLVDLGLPSGTLWYRFNLGAKSEFESGDYYQWGMLKPDNCYNEDSIYGDIKQLPVDRDIAYVKTNGLLHMPTREQAEELLTRDHEYVEDYEGSGINGVLIYGDYGDNLFLPAAGLTAKATYEPMGKNQLGYIFTTTGYDKYRVYSIFFKPDHVEVTYNMLNYGQSIRPVYNKKEE